MIDRASGRVSISSASMAARALSATARADLSNRSQTKPAMGAGRERTPAAGARRLAEQLRMGVSERGFSSGVKLADRVIGGAVDAELGLREIVARAPFDQVVFLMTALAADAATSTRYWEARAAFDDLAAVCGMFRTKRALRGLAGAVPRREIDRALKAAYRAYDAELERLLGDAGARGGLDRVLQASLVKRIAAERREIVRVYMKFDKS